jgi:hypothetical protein
VNDNAWHYTIGQHASSIYSAGVIKCATAGIQKNEKPVVWFSTQRRWEPSASKTTMLCITIEDHLDLCGSVWRFGVPTSALLNWTALCKAAKISPKWQKILINSSVSGKPYDKYSWYGSIVEVPVDKCVVECWVRGESGWRSGNLAEAEKITTDHREFNRGNLDFRKQLEKRLNENQRVLER